MITEKAPETWQALQTEVAKILAECGLTVEVEKTVATVRGEVEIDVYAEEMIKGRKHTILCECKYWKSRVPQNVIHGFRTVVADIGANIGYLISMNGFQSGSFSAAELTNVELVTWEQFQEQFEETWYDEYFSPQIAEQLDPILTYTEPLAPKWFIDLPEFEKKNYVALKQKYDHFGWMIMSFTPYARMLGRTDPRPTLPIIDRICDLKVILDTIPREILEAKGYREFFNLCLKHGIPAIEQFREIRDRNK